jgi:hypothetical protein
MVQVACCWWRLAGKCDGPSGLLLVAFGVEMRWSKWLAAGCVRRGNAMVKVACCWLRSEWKCDGLSGLLLAAFGGEIQWSEWLAAGCVWQGNAMVKVACCWLGEEHRARVQLGDGRRCSYQH